MVAIVAVNGTPAVSAVPVRVAVLALQVIPLNSGSVTALSVVASELTRVAIVALPAVVETVLEPIVTVITSLVSQVPPNTQLVTWATALTEPFQTTVAMFYPGLLNE